MSNGDDSDGKDGARLKDALDRITTAVAGGQSSAQVMELTADKAEEVAELVEGAAPGSYLWGHVSAGGPTARAVFVLGLVQPAPAQVTPHPSSDAEGTVVFQPHHEGPPGSVHGGIIAGVLDDICAIALAPLAGPRVLTRELTVRYRRPTPLGRHLTVRAEVTDIVGDDVTVEAAIRDGDEVFAQATGTFVRQR